MINIKKTHYFLILTIISILIFSCKKDKDNNPPKPFGDFRITQIDEVEGGSVIKSKIYEYTNNHLTKIIYDPQDTTYFQLVHESGKSSIKNMGGYTFSTLYSDNTNKPTKIESHYYVWQGPVVFSLNTENKIDSIYFWGCPSCRKQFSFTYSDNALISAIHNDHIPVNDYSYTFKFKQDQLIEIVINGSNSTWNYQLEYNSDWLLSFTQLDSLYQWSYEYYPDKIIRKDSGSDKETIFYIEKNAIEINSLYFMYYEIFKEIEPFQYFPVIEELGSIIMLFPQV